MGALRLRVLGAALVGLVLMAIFGGCGSGTDSDDRVSTGGADSQAEPAQDAAQGSQAFADADADDSHDHGSHDHGSHGSAGEPTRFDADLSDAEQTIEIEVQGGVPVGGHKRVKIALGSVVALRVTSDISEEVHVHAYDILRAASPGHPAHFAFKASIPGVFEVELEKTHRLLVLLEVS